MTSAGYTGGGALVELVNALDGKNAECGDGYVTFDLEDAVVEANVKDGAARLRIRACLGYADPTVVESWVARQPQPSSGNLEVVSHTDGTTEPRVVFERPVDGNDWSADPILSDIQTYACAWANDEAAAPPAACRASFQVQSEPREMRPSSAWLLLGDRASYPDQGELAGRRQEGEVGIFDCLWTAPKQTLVGDLALVYFMAPRKAAHFITRAASNAFFARDIEVNADGDVADEQRWAYFTPLIEIEPIPFRALLAVSGGHLILKGRSGKFLRPEIVEALPIRAKHPEDQAELDRVLSTPVGLAGLPRTEDVDIEAWSSIAAGALPLEAHVSSHVVEPLLRHVLRGTRLTWTREHRVRGGSIDFVVCDLGGPAVAIEVKLATVEPPSGNWSKSKDFQQLRRYTDELGVPGVLIDAHRVLLTEPGATQPYSDIARRSATIVDIERIRRHLVRS